MTTTDPSLLSSVSRSMLFSDVPPGALKPKAVEERKQAASLSEALRNLGSDINNALFFHDLASIAKNMDCTNGAVCFGLEGSQFEEEKSAEEEKCEDPLDESEETMPFDKSVTQDEAPEEDHKSVASSNKSVASRMSKAILSGDASVTAAYKNIAATEQGPLTQILHESEEQVVKGLDETEGQVMKQIHWFLNEYADGSPVKEEILYHLHRLLEEAPSKDDFVHKMNELFADAPAKEEILEELHNMYDRAPTAEEIEDQMNHVLSGAETTHDDVLDKGSNWMDSVAEGVGDFVYEVEDLGRFTKNEIQNSHVVVAVGSSVRFAKNMAGAEDREFLQKNAQLKESRRKRFRKGFQWMSIQSAGKTEEAPAPYVEGYNAEHVVGSEKCKTPPSVARQAKYDAKRAQAKKKAELLAAYERACREKKQKIVEEYRRHIEEETNEYETMVVTAGKGPRRYR